MAFKKVLIITYYWPPSGGIGVQRWLQFSKYLKNFGWQPVIFTVENANYPILDNELIHDIPKDLQIEKVKIFEPNGIFSLLNGKKKQSNNLYNLQQQSNVDGSIIKKTLWSIRGNFFIPDSRKFWIRKAIRYFRKKLANHKFDAIVSTGPPHSAHLIALKISTQNNIPWICDFRDPWTSMDYLKKMNLSNYAKRKHEELEKKVLTNATAISVVGRTIQREFLDKYNLESKLVYNGFKPNDANSNEHIDLDQKFTIVHTGSFLFNRNCNDLWEALDMALKSNKNLKKDLEIKLVGNVAQVVLDSLAKYNLLKNLNRMKHVTHQQAKEIQQSAQLLLLPIDRIENAEFVITGKLFEYLQAKRPILLIGPKNGDAEEIVTSCNAGFTTNFGEVKSIYNVILESYSQFKEKKLICEPRDVDQFSYENLTKSMVELLEKSIQE